MTDDRGVLRFTFCTQINTAISLEVPFEVGACYRARIYSRSITAMITRGCCVAESEAASSL